MISFCSEIYTKQVSQYTYNVNIESRSCNHCCSGKIISITQPVCVFVALGIQHAMRMGHIVICGYPAPQNFSTLSDKRHDFRKKKKVTEHTLCVSSFSITFV
jgi:hypothetical protein